MRNNLPKGSGFPLAALCALGITSFAAATSVVTIDVAEDAAPDWERMEQALRTLERGTPEERLAVAAVADEVFSDLGEDSDDAASGPRTRRIVAALRAALRNEPDDWIASRLLDGLLEAESEATSPLFRDALASPSPNLRRRGIEWLQEVEDPDALPLLERAWRTERRSWVRKEMLKALFYQESPTCFERFADLARDEDPELALEAVRLLPDVADPRATRLLAELSREGSLLVRLAALQAIAETDDPEVLVAILEASRDPDPRVAEPAIQILAEREDAAAEVRLAEAVDDDERLREAALLALSSRNHPMLPALADRILARGEPLPGGVLEAMELWRRDGMPRVRLGIYGMEPFLIHPALRQVAPAGGEHSAPCWKAPGIVRDSAISREVHAGAVVSILDVFESEGETWLLVPDTGPAPEGAAPRQPEGPGGVQDEPPESVSIENSSGERDEFIVVLSCGARRAVSTEGGCWMPESSLVPLPQE